MINNCLSLWILKHRNPNGLFFVFLTSKNHIFIIIIIIILSLLLFIDLLRRMHMDPFQPCSIHPAAEGLFRCSLSLARRFIQNWIYFPIPLTAMHIDEIDQILRRGELTHIQQHDHQQDHQHEETNDPNHHHSHQFCFQLLEEGCQEFRAIVMLMPEVLRPVGKWLNIKTWLIN